MKHKIAWHTYEPGLFEDSTSSTGGSVWMRYLFNEFSKNDIEIRWLSEFGKRIPYGCSSVSPLPSKDTNLVIMAWRWRMPNYPERNALYEHQWVIIDFCEDNDIPVLIHDQDHKIGYQDWNALRAYECVKIAAPQLILNAPSLYGTIDCYDMSLMFPNPFASPDSLLKVPKHMNDEFKIKTSFSYVGNNYERYEQAVRMYASVSRMATTEFWGNWLTKGGDDRPDPQIVALDFPDVVFSGRCNHSDVIHNISKHPYCVHLAKPSYNETGFITLRWAEAVYAESLAFIPSEFELAASDLLLSRTKCFSGYEILDKVRDMDALTYIDLLSSQRLFVLSKMRLEPWLKLAKGETS